jgi:hypothetical protein
MPSFHIDFDWGRDPKGYELLPVEPGKQPFKVRAPASAMPFMPWAVMPWAVPAEPDPKDTPMHRRAMKLLAKGPQTFGPSERIVPRSSRLTPYQPIAKFPDLYTRFSSVRSAAELLDFVNRFGPLTPDGLDRERGEDVPAMLKEAAAMRQVISGIGSNGGDLFGFTGGGVYDLAAMRAFLIVDRKSKELRVRLSPSSLLAALWLQLGQDFEGGASVKACRECGSLFRVGGGTGRRLDADFCSDKHRITYNSRNRSRKGKQP